MKSAVQAYAPLITAGERITAMATNNLARQVGFWSALLATLLNVVFTLAMIALPGPTWRGMYEFAGSFQIIDLLPALPSFLLAPTIIALFAAIHYYAPAEKKILSQLGLVFSAVYGGLTGINYFVQMTVVRQHISTGETAGLALFVMANPASLILAVDTLGYFFLFLASLVVAPVFEKGKPEVAIRWLLAATGILGLTGVMGYAFDNQTIYFAGLIISGIAFLAATALLTFLFRGSDIVAAGPSTSADPTARPAS